MKIIAFSDAHWLYKGIKIPECDLLIYAGDWCYGSDFKNTNNFAQWFSKHKAKHKIIVPGNHDIIAQNSPEYVDGLFSSFGITYLCDSGITIGGINIYGTPWTPTFGNWAFMGDELDIKKKFLQIPKTTDLLITHGPAYGILDIVDNNRHAGSLSLENIIRKNKIPIHICGHIHCGFGKMEGIYTHYYNVSVLDDDYKLVNEPTEILL